MKKHIIKYIDYDVKSTPTRLIMEYMELGSLRDQLKRSSSALDVVSITYQVLDALVYLHARSIVHRDLKPENILLQAEQPIHIKVADFGLAQDQPVLRTFCGSAIYCAPEIHEGGHYTEKVDIWSLGLIAFEIAYGLPRHPGPEKWREWYKAVIKKMLDWGTDEVIDFISSSMLKYEQDKRLSAEECRDKLEPLYRKEMTRALGRSPGFDLGSPTEVASVLSFSKLPYVVAHINEHKTGSVSQLYQESTGSGACKRRRIQQSCLNPLEKDVTPGRSPIMTERNDDFRPAFRSSLAPESSYKLPRLSHSAVQHMSTKELAPDPSQHEEAQMPLCICRLIESIQCESKDVQHYPEHVKVVTNGLGVSMRKSDFFICTANIKRLAGLSATDRQTNLKRAKHQTSVEVTRQASWISFGDAYLLCQNLDLLEVLAPLFKYGWQHGAMLEKRSNHFAAAQRGLGQDGKSRNR
jgi:serine/threonine protein kinase